MEPKLCCFIATAYVCWLCPRRWCYTCWRLEYQKDPVKHYSARVKTVRDSTDDMLMVGWRQAVRNGDKRICDE